MQRQLQIFITAFCLISSISAQTIVRAPGAYSLPNPKGIDYVFVFPNMTNAVIETSETINELYRLQDGDSVLLADAGMTEWLNAEDNTGYIVHTAAGRASFFVLDYSAYPISLTALIPDEDYENSCSETKLLTEGTFLPLTYTQENGTAVTIDRVGQISYTTLSWNGEAWQDSVCTEEAVSLNKLVAGQLRVTAPLCDTRFTLTADDIATQLGLEPFEISSDLYSAIAVAAQPTTITTIRGTAEENQKTNEVSRPVEESQLSGSAPMEIYFKANPTPGVVRSEWWMLKGSDTIFYRADTEHRYTFEEYGEYRALLVVSNAVCHSDTTEINISISTSQLLVPNVFTPNGDGVNDEFRVAYRSIIEFDCWVYNRWGHLVYHWTDPAKGWDGTINGRPAAEGAYYYIIRAKGADAEAGGTYHKVTKKRPASVGIYQLSGDINLLR